MNQEKTLNQLTIEIEAIKARNKRVEADKAWETSRTRTVFVALTSFLLIYIVMRLVNADHPFFNAFVSACAYYLSTSTYAVLKKWWLKKR